MIYRVAADAVLLVHLSFVLFVVLGGFVVLRHKRVVWIHLPAAAWGIGIEVAGGICPLTTIENWLRRSAGDSGYPGGFVEHYIVPVIYPAALSRATQFWLAGIALAINILIYSYIFYRRRHGSDQE